MTALNARASISIFQLFFFAPALVGAALLCLKHGFGRSSGWLFLLLVSILRIAGAGAQLDTYSNQSAGVYVASAILGSFGLSTLLLASLGLLSRTTDSINRNINGFLNAYHFRLVQLITSIGLILSIVGDTRIKFDPVHETITVPTETKAGILILLVSWIAIFLIALVTLKDMSHVSEGDRSLAWAVITTLPFLLIRTVYSILTIFLNNKDFNLIFPSAITMWTLSTIEEAFIVLIMIVIGFRTEKIESRQKAPALVREANLEAHGTQHQQMPQSGSHVNSPTSKPAPAAYKTPRQGVQWKGSIILTIIGMFRGQSGSGEQLPTQRPHMTQQRR